MMRKEYQKFIKSGLRNIMRESEKFDAEYKKTTAEIETFEKQMADRSRNRKIIRNK